MEMVPIPRGRDGRNDMPQSVSGLTEETRAADATASHMRTTRCQHSKRKEKKTLQGMLRFRRDIS